jgi:transposase InsO family protein
MNQKLNFIREWESKRYDFKSLCIAYGISRPTGYKIVKRYIEEGFNALTPRSRRPHSHPSSVSEELVSKIKKWRKEYDWGAKKIRVKLTEECGQGMAVPSVTTVHNILIREALVVPKKKRRRVVAANPVFEPECCNDIWSADYKGSFLLGDKQRCYPLTICDSYSRLILSISGRHRESSAHVQETLTKVFKEYGMPKYLHTDNGSPFASVQSPCGYGKLSYWLIDHGVHPVFSDPGCPSQNGRHERMHKDLKKRCCKPPAYNLSSQNRRMNGFVREYNEIRPHEHLNMSYPARVHEYSPREWTGKVSPPEYESDMIFKTVCKNGAVRWGSYEYIMVSSSLHNRKIGIKELGNRIWEVFYRDYSLGYFAEGEGDSRGKYYDLDSGNDLQGRRRDWRRN